MDVTEDALLGGQLRLRQPRLGPRVSVDSLLLAAFAAECDRGRSVVDLGAGVGAVALALSHFAPGARLELVERDDTLATLAEENLSLAHADGHVHRVDLEQHGLPEALRGKADLVVSNPPYFEPGTTREPSQPRQRAADVGSLSPFLRAAAAALGSRGRAAFVYPARSLPLLLARAESAGLAAKRLRLVHSTAQSPARLALIELRPGKSGGLSIEPPLVEWCEPGKRSSELGALTEGRAVGRT